MKKEEALNLQTKLKNMATDAIGFEYRVDLSLALSGKLKIYAEYIELLFDTETLKCVTVRVDRYMDISTFTEYVSKAEEFLKNNEEDVKTLIWSYENIKQLTD